MRSPIVDLSVEMTERFASFGGRQGIASMLDRPLRAPVGNADRFIRRLLKDGVF